MECTIGLCGDLVQEVGSSRSDVRQAVVMSVLYAVCGEVVSGQRPKAGMRDSLLASAYQLAAYPTLTVLFTTHEQGASTTGAL